MLVSLAIFGGFEASRRNLKVPVFTTSTLQHQIREHADETLYRGYLYWVPDVRWALSGELRYDVYTSEADFFTSNLASLPAWKLGACRFRFDILIRRDHSRVTGTPVYQDVRQRKSSGEPDGSNAFFVVDAAVGYRFPQGRGIAAIEIRNLFDADFKYRDDSFREVRQEPLPSRLIPERSIVGRLTLNF